MATKPQAKATIDTAVTAIKADIDNILPVGVDITSGQILFAPTKWFIKLNVTTQAAADSTLASLKTTLTSAGRPYTVTNMQGLRRDDGTAPKFMVVDTALCVYTISGY